MGTSCGLTDRVVQYYCPDIHDEAKAGTEAGLHMATWVTNMQIGPRYWPMYLCNDANENTIQTSICNKLDTALFTKLQA